MKRMLIAILMVWAALFLFAAPSPGGTGQESARGGSGGWLWTVWVLGVGAAPNADELLRSCRRIHPKAYLKIKKALQTIIWEGEKYHTVMILCGRDAVKQAPPRKTEPKKEPTKLEI